MKLKTLGLSSWGRGSTTTSKFHSQILSYDIENTLIPCKDDINWSCTLKLWPRARDQPSPSHLIRVGKPLKSYLIRDRDASQEPGLWFLLQSKFLGEWECLTTKLRTILDKSQNLFSEIMTTFWINKEVSKEVINHFECFRYHNRVLHWVFVQNTL